MTIRGVQGGSGSGSTTIINNITNNITTQGNGLLSGGGVAWTGLLNFTVSAASYIIQSTTYSSPQTNLTLAAADPTLDRIDIIAVNTSGAAVVITGTPAATPAAPDVDPTTQLELTFVYVAAAATTPSNITTTQDIYHENTEWTTTVSANLNAASTNNPHLGTKDVEGTAVVATNFVRFQNGSTIDLADSNNLVFWIYPKAAWASTRSLQLQWSNGGQARGQPIVLREGSFGFVSGSASYQQIVIPLSQFQANGLAVNRLQVTAFGTGGTMGFYLDDFVLQSGLGQPNISFMNWVGVYSTTHQYAKNDVVTSAGAAWIALNANSASTPAVNNSDWQLIAPIRPVNSQTGATYTVLTSDLGKQISINRATAVAVTLPQASAAFPSGWFTFVQNRGAGTVTITPTTSTIDGAASLVLTQNQGCMITSDGTNYFTMRGVGGGSSTGPNPVAVAMVYGGLF